MQRKAAKCRRMPAQRAVDASSTSWGAKPGGAIFQNNSAVTGRQGGRLRRQRRARDPLSRARQPNYVGRNNEVLG